jgi:hypothetical protein
MIRWLRQENQLKNFKNIVMEGKYVTTLVLLAALSGRRMKKTQKQKNCSVIKQAFNYKIQVVHLCDCFYYVPGCRITIKLFLLSTLVR